MFYDNLKKACKNKGISVTATLKEIGIGGANGTFWKNGSVPASDIVVKLSKFLNVSTDYLLIGEDKNSSSDKVSEDEQELLSIYRELSIRNQGKLIGRAETMLEQQRAESRMPTSETVETIAPVLQPELVHKTD